LVRGDGCFRQVQILLQINASKSGTRETQISTGEIGEFGEETSNRRAAYRPILSPLPGRPVLPVRRERRGTGNPVDRRMQRHMMEGMGGRLRWTLTVDAYGGRLRWTLTVDAGPFPHLDPNRRTSASTCECRGIRRKGWVDAYGGRLRWTTAPSRVFWGLAGLIKALQ
jgi:hypothetical protein